MDNKNLMYSKDALKVGFAKSDVAVQIDRINTIANSYRGWGQPIFADEHKCLPTMAKTSILAKVAIPDTNTEIISTKDLTVPPTKQNDSRLLEGIGLAVGIVLAIKLLS